MPVFGLILAIFGLILAIFGLILAMFLTFQSYDFDALAHAFFGCRMAVQNFMKNRMDSF